MHKKSLTISEIRQKYYSTISEEDFIKIASIDSISSNMQKNKLGKYAKWLLNLYKHKCLKLEDLYKATDYIATFDKVAKMKIYIDLDLNHYKSLSQMYKMIKPYMKIIGKSEKIRNIKTNESEILFEDGIFLVIHPKTKRASMLYGKGTQWCTAAKYGNNFRDYNKMGKLYIIIDKRNGKKYQFHIETESFMNENDEPINLSNNFKSKPISLFNDFKSKPISLFNNFRSYTLEKINVTDRLFDYFNAKYKRYLTCFFFNGLNKDNFIEIVRNNDFCILQILNPKSFFHYLGSLSHYEIRYSYRISEYSYYSEDYFKMGKLYIFYDVQNAVRYVLSENIAGFFEICFFYNQNYGNMSFCFRKRERNITPKMDYYLKKLKIHPDWKIYSEIFYNGQTYYIVKKNAYYALYNAYFEEIIGKQLSAEQIYTTPTSQPVIIKNKYTGLLDIDTGTIRWGYKGVVDKKIDWVKGEVALI